MATHSETNYWRKVALEAFRYLTGAQITKATLAATSAGEDPLVNAILDCYDADGRFRVDTSSHPNATDKLWDVLHGNSKIR